MTRFSSYIWLSCLALATSACAYGDPAPQLAPTPAVDVQVPRTTAATYIPLSIGRPAVRVTPISDAMRQDFSIPAFYAKGLMVRGMPIVSSNKASDYALLESAYLLDHMFADSPAWVQAALTKNKCRMAVMSALEYTMDLPENLEWQTDRSVEKMAFWDQRARGMGGLPLASCAEENLLNLKSDPYRSENITLHEFSHTLASALNEVNPEWYKRLEAAYKKAMNTGRFAHSYAANNEQEYWAEGSQDWFSCNSPAKDSIHNGIWNREQVKVYDPDLAKLLSEVYGQGSWRYIRTDGKPLQANGGVETRPSKDMAHLAGLNRSQMPAFNVANSPRVQALKQTTQPDAGKQ